MDAEAKALATQERVNELLVPYAALIKELDGDDENVVEATSHLVSCVRQATVLTQYLMKMGIKQDAITTMCTGAAEDAIAVLEHAFAKETTDARPE